MEKLRPSEDSSLKNLRDILIDLLYKIIKGDISNLLEFENKFSSYKEKRRDIKYFIILCKRYYGL